MKQVESGDKPGGYGSGPGGLGQGGGDEKVVRLCMYFEFDEKLVKRL